jgi:hypothetical protein
MAHQDGATAAPVSARIGEASGTRDGRCSPAVAVFAIVRHLAFNRLTKIATPINIRATIQRPVSFTVICKFFVRARLSALLCQSGTKADRPRRRRSLLHLARSLTRQLRRAVVSAVTSISARRAHRTPLLDPRFRAMAVSARKRKASTSVEAVGYTRPTYAPLMPAAR